MHFVHELQNFILQFQYFHIHTVQYQTKFYVFEKWLKQKRNRQIHCGLSYWLPSESEKRMQEKYQRTVSLPPISYTVSNICIVFTPNSIKASIMQLQTWPELLDFWSWTCKALFEWTCMDYENWNGWHLLMYSLSMSLELNRICWECRSYLHLSLNILKIVFMAVLKINRMIYLCTYLRPTCVHKSKFAWKDLLVFAQIYREYHVPLRLVCIQVKVG